MQQGRDVVLDTTGSSNARLRPVPISAVRVNEKGFWHHWREVVRDTSLERQFEHCEETGRLDNFRRASGRKEVPEYSGLFFNDSDVYKLLEAASFGLIEGVSDSVAGWIDLAIDEIGAAQRDDGYINSYFTFEREDKRYQDLCNQHELYCMGHLIQAGIAHRRASGSSALFDIAVRAADHICETFGYGRLELTDGHQEIELALVELHRETGNQAYLDQALFFLEMRGQPETRLNGEPRFRDPHYYQDHLPVREQHEAWGHAVRMMYQASGMADIVLEREDLAMQAAVFRLWESAYGRKSYLTGALGARFEGEAFGADFELPNERAYAETCAAIGGVFFSFRLLCLTGDARYADAIETQLYNSIISGLSHDGTGYFYMNPLAARGDYHRDEWFTCSCCPPNVARLLLSLPGYCYSTSTEGLWLHQYLAGSVSAGGFELDVDTAYPWQGQIQITIKQAPAGQACLRIRIPAWAEGATAMISGQELDARPGAYLVVERQFNSGEVLNLYLPMPVRSIYSNPRITDNAGRVAIARGPLIYCIEVANRASGHAYDLALKSEFNPRVSYDPDLVGGANVIRADGAELEPGPDADFSLYSDVAPARRALGEAELVAIPYFSWGNREPSSMQVWIPQLQNGL